MKISIVTVSFNSAATIERTMKSVVEQTYADLEHVIVDGGSKDSTMEIVRRFPARLGAVVSEPDRGIYDAMNKGFALAKGEFVLFLNSDDWLAGPTVIADAVARFRAGFRMQHGRLAYFHRDGRVSRMGAPVELADLRFELKNLHQPATFFHRDLFRDYGGFDIRYRISADYDLMRRFLGKAPSHFLDLDVTNMSDNGASATQHARGVSENREIARRFGESSLRTWANGAWTRFWLWVRYRIPVVYWVVKGLRDRLAR